MCYSIKRILQRIRKNILIYIILSIELAIGITFIVYALNHVYSTLNRQQILENMMTNQTYSLKIYKNDSVKNIDDNEMAISYEDYRQIQKKVNDTVSYYVIKNDIGFNNDNVFDIKLIYTDLIREDYKKNEALYGKDLKNYINDDTLKNIESLKIKNKILKTIKNNKTYKLKEIPDKYKTITLPSSLTSEDIQLNNCILLPLEDYTYFENEDLANYMLYFNLNKEDPDKAVQKILEYLRKVHGKNFTYEFTNPLNEYEISSNSLTELSRYLGRMAIVMLVILLLGFTSVIKIFIRKRERDLAISMALGVPKKTLILELFIEALTICTVGDLVGILIGSKLTSMADISVFNLNTHFETIMICLILGFVITILITAPSVKRIYKMNPIEILRSV